ncbi:MAG TPA: response regulator transcription factor [Candidatus Dormibacteraeota bacterium]|nr:response regulator transcription factor [Candidatus Dormibacteraeota bacterium]
MIVENHELVSESLSLLLEAQPDMVVVAQAASVREAAMLPPTIDPDVVVMDFHLDDGTGRDAAFAMRKTHPGARFMFLSRDSSDTAQLAAIEAGAAAYVLKSAPASDVIAAVRSVADGETLITPAAIAGALRRGRAREEIRVSLSPREREVLELISHGLPSREVAKRLGVSYSTVRTHVRSINTKLGAHSKLNAVVAARELELIN